MVKCVKCGGDPLLLKKKLGGNSTTINIFDGFGFLRCFLDLKGNEIQLYEIPENELISRFSKNLSHISANINSTWEKYQFKKLTEQSTGFTAEEVDDELVELHTLFEGMNFNLKVTFMQQPTGKPDSFYWVAWIDKFNKKTHIHLSFYDQEIGDFVKSVFCEVSLLP